MRFEVHPPMPPYGPATKCMIVRAHDRAPITHDELPRRLAEQVCDILNDADAEIEPLPPHPLMMFAFADPEQFSAVAQAHFDAKDRINRVITDLWNAVGVKVVHA